MKLQWRNKLSGETGYVKSVSVKKGYFENTFNKAEAKNYANEGFAKADLKKLESFGEFENNDFTIIK